MSVHDKIATAAFKGAGNGGKSNTENSRVGRPGLANNTVRRKKKKSEKYDMDYYYFWYLSNFVNLRGMKCLATLTLVWLPLQTIRNAQFRK